MRLIPLYVLVGTVGSFMGVTHVLAKTVLAPGETQVIGGEEVVCSARGPESAKLYISCSSRDGYPRYILVAEDGSLSSTIKVRDPYDMMCTPTKEALKTRTTKVSEPVEITICAFENDGAALNTYMLYPAGNSIFVGRHSFLDKKEDCIKAANKFNQTP